MKVFRIVNNKA